MKKIAVNILLLFWFAIFGNQIIMSQELSYSVTYREYWIPPYSPEFSFDELRNLPLHIKKQLKAGGPENHYTSHFIMELEHVNGMSKYTIVDSYMANYRGERKSQTNDQRLKPLGRSSVFKDFQNGEVYIENKSQNAVWVREIPFNDWSIHWDETREIFGYQSIKATTTDLSGEGEIIAWFTEEIPLNNGPKFYDGLPGLILRVRNGNTIIEIIDIDIRQSDSEPIAMPEHLPAVETYQQWIDSNYN